jgi:hypothetical protein
MVASNFVTGFYSVTHLSLKSPQRALLSVVGHMNWHRVIRKIASRCANMASSQRATVRYRYCALPISRQVMSLM